jgi:hypothetical protein
MIPDTQHGDCEQQNANQTSDLKVPKCENFDLLFFTLINHIWYRRLMDWKIFLFHLKTEADTGTRHFVKLGWQSILH